MPKGRQKKKRRSLAGSVTISGSDEDLFSTGDVWDAELGIIFPYERFPKLVRDRIPDAIREDGFVPILSLLDEDEFREALFKKLGEEASELRDSDGDARLEELADVFEVLRALATVEGFTLEDITAAANAKRELRGAFDLRQFVERVERARPSRP